MDERAAASRVRANAKRHLTVELNVTEALIVDGQTERVRKEQLAELKETFIDTCNRYAETFTEDELTEEVCDRLAAYSSEQLQFYVRVMSKFSTPNVVKQDVALEANNNLQKLLTLMSLPKIQLEPFGGYSVDYYNFMAEFDKLVDEVSGDAQERLMGGRKGYRNCRRMSINSQLDGMCRQEKVGFVDLWATFAGRPDLYRKDGLHMTDRGAEVLGAGLARAMGSGGAPFLN